MPTGRIARSLAEVYRLAGEAKRPVLIHTGTSIFPGARNVYADPMACDDVAVDFPRRRIVLCHAGRPLWYETAFFLLRRHPNVMIDISSIPPKRLLEVLPRLPRWPIASFGEPTGHRRGSGRCARTSTISFPFRFRTRSGGRSFSKRGLALSVALSGIGMGSRHWEHAVASASARFSARTSRNAAGRPARSVRYPLAC